MRKPSLAMILLLAVLASCSIYAAETGNALADAKRKLAAQMISRGDFDQAVALLNEVIGQDKNHYQDHFALAQAYDKLHQPDKALVQYKIVLDLTVDGRGNRDVAKARAAALKRTKVANPLIDKLDLAADEFSKKVDGLEKQAIQQQDMAALETIWRYKAALWKAENKSDRVGVEVFANKGDYQDAGMDLLPGYKYHIVAAGKWTVLSNVECTADGIPAKKPGQGPAGLLYSLSDEGPVAIGSRGEMVVKKPTRLKFMCCIDPGNGGIGRDQAYGSVMVMVEREGP